MYATWPYGKSPDLLRFNKGTKARLHSTQIYSVTPASAKSTVGTRWYAMVREGTRRYPSRVLHTGYLHLKFELFPFRSSHSDTRWYGRVLIGQRTEAWRVVNRSLFTSWTLQVVGMGKRCYWSTIVHLMRKRVILEKVLKKHLEKVVLLV